MSVKSVLRKVWHVEDENAEEGENKVSVGAGGLCWMKYKVSDQCGLGVMVIYDILGVWFVLCIV